MLEKEQGLKRKDSRQEFDQGPERKRTKTRRKSCKGRRKGRERKLDRVG